MPTQSQFVKNQDRTYFNVHRPVPLPYNEPFYKFNKRGPLEPKSEVDRQTGSGIGDEILKKIISRVGHPKVNKLLREATGGGPRFTHGPVPPPYYGSGAMKNNYDIRAPAPVVNIAHQLMSHSIHAPIISKIKHPIQRGGQAILKQQPNPAVNNWKVGVRVPEPNNVYEYSPQFQIHSTAKPLIQALVKRPLFYDGVKSYDDLKPLRPTKAFYDQGEFRHVKRNALRPQLANVSKNALNQKIISM